MNIKLSACIASVLTASAALAASLGGGGILGAAWVYIPSESVISNDNAVGKSTDYVLNVSVVDADKHTLAIGKGTGGDAYCFDDNGSFKGGTVLDLSESVADASGTTWTIVHFNKNCFWKDDAPFRTFVAPKELASIDSKVFGYNLSSDDIVDATFDCPYLKQINNGMSEKKFVKLHLKVPNCVKIETYALTRLAAVDVSDWDFSGVQTIGLNALPVWEGGPLTGILKLPELCELAGSVFSNSKYTRMEWGNRHNTLTSVGENAFNNAVSCEELVIGCAEDCTFAKSAVGAASLSRVWMTGAVPTFSTDDIVFGTSSHTEKSIVFYVPDTEEWATIRANATELTDDERYEFEQAHPDWDVPFGIVAADVFHTQGAQYIGTADLASLNAYSYVSVGNRSATQYGDSVSITVDGTELTSDDVLYGTEVTVTAKPKNSETVVSWEGKLPDGTTPTGNSFTYTATADAAFYAVFANPWEYDAEAGTISDGYWTLKVAAGDNNTLTVSGKADGQTGTGELNLSGKIYTKGDSTTTWTITKIGDQSFKNDTVITSFYTPTAGLVEWGSQVFNNASAVTNAVFNCPNITTKTLFIWGYDFPYCPMDRLVLNLPNLTRIGNNDSISGIMGSATMAASDLGEWDLSSLTFITQYGLQAGAANGVGPKGNLVLPNVETICKNAFYNWTRVESAALGTNGTLKVLGAYLFANNTSALKKLDFGKSYNFTTETTTFLADESTALPLEEVWFSDKAPSTTTLDNILVLKGASDTALTTDSVKVFAPLSLKSWRDVTKELTTDEASAKATLKAQGYKVIGAYVKTTGERAAWLVQNPAFKYSQGFLLYIR